LGNDFRRDYPVVTVANLRSIDRAIWELRKRVKASGKPKDGENEKAKHPKYKPVE